jgi:hypothetical protein
MPLPPSLRYPRRTRRGDLIRRVVVVLALAASLLAVPTAPAGAVATDGVDLVPVVSGIGAVDITAPPGDDRLFLVERAGRIRIFEDGQLLTTPFLDITGPVYSGGGEQGLLGLAFDPDYASNGRFYVDYTADAGGGDTRIVRYTVSDNDPNRADPASAKILVTQNQPYSNHNGGQVAVGPDGYVYAAFGDGGSGGDPDENAQNTNNILGSIIRIDPDSGDGPPGNPFVGKPGDDRIWVYGLRNPWRFAFDDATGDMLIGDVGQSAWEEVDHVEAGASGINFGWDVREGNHCYEPPTNCGSAGLTGPIHEFSHAGGNCSIIGGKVYRGNLLPQLRGHYFYADLCSGSLSSFRLRDGRAVDHQEWGSILDAPGSPLSFGLDGFGEMYLSAGGTIYRFVPDRDPECDFDGDGRADLPVGVPGESHSGARRAGVVQVFPGTPAGLIDASADLTLRQGAGLPGEPERGDGFGQSLACGDFDGDGFQDLVIGVPKEDRAGAQNAGVVVVVPGSQSGLVADEAQSWSQGSGGVPGAPEPGDRFGAALASGDFNADGYADLAIGIPSEDIGAASNAGAVQVLYGSSSGLEAGGLVHRGMPGIKGGNVDGGRFGAALAAGDFDGDGRADLAVGVPGDDVAGRADAGSVHLVFGTSGGLGARDERLHRGSAGIKGKLKAGTEFGTSVAAGTLDLDGFDDLVAGAPGSGGRDVSVVFGGRDGLSKRDVRLKAGVGLPAGSGNVGRVVAAGNIEGNVIDELALGAPNAGGAGRVTTVPGGLSGPRTNRSAVWDRDTGGIAGPAAEGDGFGTAIHAIDLDGNGLDDLAIGIPQPVTGGHGEVTILKGRRSGVTPVGDVRLRQGAGGAGGAEEAGDRFGWAL